MPSHHTVDWELARHFLPEMGFVIFVQQGLAHFFAQPLDSSSQHGLKEAQCSYPQVLL